MDNLTRPDFESPRFSDRFVRVLALVAGGVIALVVLLSLLQCSLKTPEAPSWDSTLRIPVTSDHLSIANLLLRFPDGDDWVSESGQIGLFWSDTLDTVRLSPDLALPTQTTALHEVLGRVSVAAPAPDSVRTPLSDYYSGSAGNIPPVSFSDVDTLVMSGYTWIAPGSGEAWLRVENQVGLPFDSVTIGLTDLDQGSLGTFNFAGGLTAGAHDSLPLGLAGRKFSNRIQYQLNAHTPGGTLLALANRYLELSVGFSDSLALDSGLLEVPQVTRSQSQALGFSGNGDVVSLRTAELSAGHLNLTVTNRTGLASAVTVTVPAFTLSGVPLTRNLALAPGATVNASVNLAGYDFDPEILVPPQSFDLHVVATTVPTSPAQVRIDRDDSVAVSAQVTGLVAARLSGVLAPMQRALPSAQTNVNAPGEWSAFHAAEALLTVEVVNGTGAPAQLHLRLDNGTDSQIVSGPVTVGASTAPSVTTLTNSNLAALFDPYPTSLQVSGLARFGDSVFEVTISDEDFALARVNVAVPLAVRIDTITITGSAERLVIEGTDVPGLLNKIRSATFHADVVNHLPVGAEVKFFAALDSADVYSAPDLVLGPVIVGAGQTLPSGVTSATAHSTADLPLDEADLEYFKHGVLFVGYGVFLPGSSGQIVRFVAADYLDLHAHFDLTFANGGDAW